MKAALILLALLAGCTKGDGPDTSEWACSKVGVYTAKQLGIDRHSLDVALFGNGPAGSAA